MAWAVPALIFVRRAGHSGKVPVATFLQRANARNYADAYVVSVLASMGFLLIALASSFCLPTPRRPKRE